MELGYRSIYEVTGGKFTLTRFEPDRVNGRRLVRETYRRGEQFTAYNYEVPAGFMDLLRVVGPSPEVPPVPPPKGEVPTEDRDGKAGKESRKTAPSEPEPEPEPEKDEEEIEEKKEPPPRPTRRRSPTRKK